jgi:hypothetical protein
MIEVMAALAVANSAFKSVQTLMGRGAELEQMGRAVRQMVHSSF